MARTLQIGIQTGAAVQICPQIANRRSFGVHVDLQDGRQWQADLMGAYRVQFSPSGVEGSDPTAPPSLLRPDRACYFWSRKFSVTAANSGDMNTS